MRRIVGGDQNIIDAALREISARNSNPSHLEICERLAIWIYTSTDQGWYLTVNSGLRGMANADILDFADLLDGALRKLPRHQGKSYRGIDVDEPDLYVLNFIRYKPFVWKSFTSTTLERDQAFDGNISFIVSGHNGRALGPYADRISEEEVLFPSRSKFAMTEVEPIGGDYLMLLDEVV